MAKNITTNNWVQTHFFCFYKLESPKCALFQCTQTRQQPIMRFSTINIVSLQPPSKKYKIFKLQD